jgi:competence protein ComEC
VPDDSPAALPLTGFTAGLALAPLLVNEGVFALGLVAIALLWRRRGAAVLLFTALGIFVSMRHDAHDAAQRHAFDPDRFTVIEAPLDRDWSPRGDAFVLRARSFVANGTAVDAPVAFYARFQPPPLAMFATLHAEGFLRTNERGEYVVSIKSSQLLSYSGVLRPWHPATWNRFLANRIRPLAEQHPDEVALIDALVLGRGERLTDDVRNGFKRGGTYHLLIFSGLQIGLAAGLIALLMRWLHAPRVADWSLLAFAVLAPLFVGTSASVARASGGIALYAVSRILKRPTTLENLWCVSALLRLLFVPAELADAAFQLTYAGAGALLFAGKRAHGRWRWIACAVAVEAAVTPLTLFHFHQFALGGSVTTILLTPLVLAMLLAGGLVCAIPIPSLLRIVTALHVVCSGANDVAAHASGSFAAPPLAAMIAGFGAAMLAIALLRPRARAIAVVAAFLIPSIAAVKVDRARRSVDAPHVVMLDVGQGDGILVRDGAHAMLVDGGPRDSHVLEQLVDRGVRELDAVVLTHAHPDHCGGLPDVIERLHVHEVWISPRRFRGDCAARMLDACAASATPIRLLRDRRSRPLGGIIVTPLLAGRTFKRGAENNASVVLRLRIGTRHVLLTGDIEKEAEAELVSSGEVVRADVLKVGHHGSRTSSTATLLNAVRPSLALISCGRHNLFGHPHASVISALRQRHIRFLETDRNGAIDVAFRGGRIAATVEIDTP